MTSAARGEVFYGDLAPWWPLLSPPGEYAEEAGFAASLLASAPIPVREVLELGSGGGSNAVHLTERFALTLVDISPQMLAVSAELNPGSEHIVGDMRTVQLDRQFDAVFIHDAIDYMTTEPDLLAVLATAYQHCRAGGVVVIVPDHTLESFAPSTDHGGIDSPDGRGARYLSWTWDPDPADTWVQTEYCFLLRSADGTVRSAQETHRTGVFARSRWLELLARQGFDARIVPEITAEERAPRDFFVGYR